LPAAEGKIQKRSETKSREKKEMGLLWPPEKAQIVTMKSKHNKQRKRGRMEIPGNIVIGTKGQKYNVHSRV